MALIFASHAGYSALSASKLMGFAGIDWLVE
jgi:hypothetical protein